MKPPRGLSASETVLWRKVAATVEPLAGRTQVAAEPPDASPNQTKVAATRQPGTNVTSLPKPASAAPRAREENLERRTLDASWDRRLAHGLVSPDAQIDLHGLGLDAAYDRLMASLAQAHAIGARVVLVIAGKPRPHGEHGFSDHGQRGNRRGAIRAKLLDWLAASAHASRIAAIRPAHQRHGGAGAVYVVLRRPR